MTNRPTEKQIFEDAINKHGLRFRQFSGKNLEIILALIRYARQIGYNEGYIDYEKEHPE